MTRRRLLAAVFLGLVQAATEFLPVSSTGHMVIAMPLLGVDPETPQWKPSHRLRNASIGVIVAMVALAVLGFAARPPTDSTASETPPVVAPSDDGSTFESPSPSAS